MRKNGKIYNQEMEHAANTRRPRRNHTANAGEGDRRPPPKYTVATRHRRSETLETTTAIYDMLQKQNRHQTMQNAMHSMWKGEMATPLCRRSEHHTKMQHLPRNMAA